MIKRILKIWFTIAMYELGKWIGREVYYKLTANREYQIADNITGLDEYAEIEVDTLDGVIQIMEGIEREYKEDE